MNQQVLATLVISVVAFSCASLPLDQQFTQRQLLEQLHKKPVCEARLTNGSEWTPNYKKCNKEWAELKQKLTTAYFARHAREISAAPACLSEWKVEPSTLARFGISPNVTNAPAELISRGISGTAATHLSPECVTEVCAWQLKSEPDRDLKTWCSTLATPNQNSPL